MTAKTLQDVIDNFKLAIGSTDMSNETATEYVKFALAVWVNPKIRRTYVVTSGDAISPALPSDDNDSSLKAIVAATVLARINPEMFLSAARAINQNLPTGHIDSTARPAGWKIVRDDWVREWRVAARSLIHREPKKWYGKVDMTKGE